MAGFTIYFAIVVASIANAHGSIPTVAHGFGWRAFKSMIYGGTPIKITEVPFMAFLRTPKYPLWCGAVIIHERFLVTAAHCSYVSGLFVTVGTDRTDKGGEKHEIEKIFIHPNYNGNYSFDYDLAVIKLKEKLTWNEKVATIEMATSLPNDGDDLDTSGFGRTENENYSKVLLGVKIPYVNRTKCEKQWAALLTDNMICAGGEKGKNVCSGDSGSALRDTQGKLIGVVSFGSRQCAKEGIPSVFAYVPSMRKFIDDTINNNA